MGKFSLAVIVIAGALAVAAAVPAYELTVTAEDGQVLWHLPVRPGTPAVLAYTNSIYKAPTEERFRLSGSGFKLIAVRSTSEAVLAYNALPGPYIREGEFYAAGANADIPALVIRIGETGRQRLTVGETVLPLHAAGTGRRVVVEIKRVPFILRLAR